MAFPMTAANAITMPIDPAVSPNASATRAAASAGATGASRLTTNAAATSARNAWSRAPTISPTTVAIPTASVTSGWIIG